MIVGDVDPSSALDAVERHFGPIPAGPLPRRTYTREPDQLGERRVTVAREGTTAYLQLAYHAPALDDPAFFPMVVLDAVLTGAKGLNLWASFRTSPPQRSSRLYRGLVEQGLASSVEGSMLPTRDPFLYSVSVTATEGVTLEALEARALEEMEAIRCRGVSRTEVERARNQLRARLVFENDSVTNIGHQIGYFETIASWQVYETLLARVQAVTEEDVSAAAARYLVATNRTVGRFEPQASGGDAPAVSAGR